MPWTDCSRLVGVAARMVVAVYFCFPHLKSALLLLEFSYFPSTI